MYSQSSQPDGPSDKASSEGKSKRNGQKSAGYGRRAVRKHTKSLGGIRSGFLSDPYSHRAHTNFFQPINSFTQSLMSAIHKTPNPTGVKDTDHLFAIPNIRTISESQSKECKSITNRMAAEITSHNIKYPHRQMV